MKELNCIVVWSVSIVSAYKTRGGRFQIVKEENLFKMNDWRLGVVYMYVSEWLCGLGHKRQLGYR